MNIAIDGFNEKIKMMMTSIVENKMISVCHDVKDVDFLIVVLIAHDVRRIVIVVANLRYCIGLKMKASI